MYLESSEVNQCKSYSIEKMIYIIQKSFYCSNFRLTNQFKNFNIDLIDLIDSPSEDLKKFLNRKLSNNMILHWLASEPFI